MFSKIKIYDEFVDVVNKIGFLLLSKNTLGYISLVDITEENSWHKGNEYDPWLWKDKFAFEKKGAYTRIFDKRPIFISYEWYPYFLSLYKHENTIEERYENGTLNKMAFRLYNALKEHGPLNTHDIKIVLSITSKDEKSAFEKGIVELQRNMDITVHGASKKINKNGEPYGWLVSEYSTVDKWLGTNQMENLKKITKEEAIGKLKFKIREVVPTASDKEINKFLNIK